MILLLSCLLIVWHVADFCVYFVERVAWMTLVTLLLRHLLVVQVVEDEAGVLLGSPYLHAYLRLARSNILAYERLTQGDGLL